MIHSAVVRGGSVLVIAHRRELIDQVSIRLDQFGVDHGVIMANHQRHKPWLPVQVASIATLARRMTLADGTPHPNRPRPSLIIIDEAHHARAGTYLKILECFPGVAVIGLTATPWRTDGKGLGELFEALVVAATPAELIDAGHLVRYAGFSYQIPNLEGVKTTGGDYDGLQLSERCSTVELVGGIVEQYQEHSPGKRAVVFAVGVAHSQMIVSAFTKAGIAAEHLDGETPNDLRAAILARLASGETHVVSNCAVLTEGWDCPAVEVCILARPTKSAGLFMQMVGRVLRPAPGKALARIHDHAGCMIEHGLPDRDRDYSLECDVEKKRKGGKAAVAICPECMATCDIDAESCPQCGVVFDVPKGSGREVKYVDGIAMTIDDIRAMFADDTRRATNATMQQKAAEFKRLEIVRERKGFLPGWVANEFRRTFGVWPRIPQAILDATPAATQPFVPYAEAKKLRAAREAMGLSDE